MSTTAHSATRRSLLQAASSLSFLSLLPATVVAAPAAVSKEISGLEAINQAGRQRMLSQRIAKLYAQNIRGTRQAESLKLLTASIALFEKQLINLSSFAQQKGAAEISATYAQLGVRWADYKAIISAPPSHDGLKQVATLNEQVLATAQIGTVQLEKLQGTVFAKLVNISGRQRMLSQRISKFYFFARNGMSSADITKGLSAARTEFMQAMNTLKDASENTSAISAWIAMAESQWIFFNDAINAHTSDRQEQAYFDSNVATSSENILEAMDKLTNLYTALT